MRRGWRRALIRRRWWTSEARSARRARIVRVGLRLRMARRRIAPASRMRFARAVGQPRTERRLAAANLLQEIWNPQRRRKRQRDDHRARNARILPRQEQLDSEHVLTSA